MAFIPLLTKKNLLINKKILLSNPNSELIAQKNQEINKCQNALKDLCDSLWNILEHAIIPYFNSSFKKLDDMVVLHHNP